MNHSFLTAGQAISLHSGFTHKLLHVQRAAYRTTGTMTVGRAVLLLLGFASLLAVEATQPKTENFAAWIAAQPSARVQTAYEEVETVQVCLHELGYQNCRCLHDKTVDGTPYCTREHIE